MAAKKGDEAYRRLFAAPLREFIHQRDALARELRAKGAMDEARALVSLRKPSVGLWIANQLSRLAPDEVRALIEATARLRQGQSAALRGSPAETLREAMRAQREALARLTEAAGRAALEAQTTLTLELQRRVQNTVQAAAASDPEALRGGTLEKELQPSGFEELLATAPPLEEKPAPGKRDAPAVRTKKDEVAAALARDKEETAARAREKERARALLEAEMQERRIDAQAKKLAGLADDLEQQAARARERAEEAQRQANAAAARVRQLRGQ